MAILDDLLNKLKRNTLDKTNIDERIVNAVRPLTQLPRQAINQYNPEINDSIANRIARSKAYDNLLVKPQQAIQSGNILNRFKQPEEAVKRNPWLAFTNASLDTGNTLMKMPMQVGYDLANKRMWQGKEAPISDPVNLGKLLPEARNLKTMTPEQRKMYLSEVGKRAVGSVKPIALASGLNAPKIVGTMTALGGGLGYGGARLQGQKGKEAVNTAIQSAGEQFGRAIPMAGLMRFTNPVGDKLGQMTLDKLAKAGAPKFAQFLGKYTAQGGLNTAEGIALNPLIDRPMFEDVLVDFLMPGTLAITGKSLKGVTSGGFKLLKDSLRRMDPEGFDGAVKLLKEQGVKLADTAVNEVRLVLDGANKFASPDVQLAVNGRYIKGANGKFLGSNAMERQPIGLAEESAKNLQNTEKVLQKELQLKDAKPVAPGFTRTYRIEAGNGSTPWRWGSENELRKWIGSRSLEGERIIIEDNPTNQLEVQPNGAYKLADKNLVAMHSGQLDRILDVKEGKLAMPSIAITRKDIPLENFGDTTFIGNRKLITPGKDMKVYSNDIYSPTTPKPEYNVKPIDSNFIQEVTNRNIYTGDISTLDNKDDFIQRLTSGMSADRTKPVNYFTEAEAKKIAEQFYGEPVIKLKKKNPTGQLAELIRTVPGLRSFYKESKNHYDFTLLAENDERTLRGLELYAKRKGLDDPYELLRNEEDYYEIAPYNADNITKKIQEHLSIFNQDELRGSQQGWGATAPERVSGARQFKTVDDIKGSSNLLDQKEAVEAIGTERDDAVTNYLYSVAKKTDKAFDEADPFKEPYNMLKGYDGQRELVKSALVYIQQNGKLGEQGLRSIVTYNENGKTGFYAGGEDVLKYVNPNKFEKMVRQAYMDIPTEYFEAKALRTVNFNEFDGIIVPKGETARLQAELGDKVKGLKIVEYDPDIPNDRRNIIQKHFSDSMFGIVPIIEPQYDENGNVTGYKFSAEKTAMASLAVGGLREIKKGDLDSAMKSLNRLPSFKGYGENAKDLIVQEAKRLADSIEGVEIIQNGIDSGRGIRVSRNPEWYRSFYSNNGRPPTNQELFELAEDNLRTNRLTGDINDPNELKAVNEFLDAEIKGTEQPISDIMPKSDTLALPARQNVPLLQSPQEVINSKKKLIDIFKKTGEVKPYLNQLRPKTKAIPMGEQIIPGAKSGDEARAIKEQYGKMPEIQQQNVPGTNKVYEQPGLTIDDRGKRIEEVLYGSATPERQDLGGKKEGAGLFSNLMRKGQGMVSDRVGEALSSSNSIVRNTASILQDLAGNLGKSGEQVTKRSQFAGGIDYATKMGNDTQRYVTDLLGKDLGSLERVHSVLDPELATTKVDYENLSPKEKEATDFLRYVSDFINETNYKNGFITEEKYRSNTGGKYIARAYEPYDFPPEFADFMEQRNQKLDLNPFKERGDVTDWKQENAVKDPAYLVAKRLQQTMFNDNFRNMANWLKSTELVSESPKPGYVQVSDHKAYGDMAGQYVRKDALEDIKGFFFANQTAQKAYDMLNAWDKLAPRRFRKKMLTVFNPATRLGNQVGNYVFAWFNGINPVTFGSNKGWAKNAIKSNDPLYRRAIQDGLLGTDLTRGDIQRFASELKTGTKDPGILQKINQTLSDSYGRVDDLAKLSALKTHLDRGYSYEEAYKRVYNGFQNYNAVGFLYDVGAKIPLLGNPFVRFKADILRMMKNAVMDHPIRAVGTVLAWKLFTDLTSMASNETEEDKAVREDRLGAPRIPFTDVSLAVQTPWGELNASRLIGLYSLNQLNESSNTGDVFDYLPFEKPAIKNLGSDPLIGGLVSLATDTDFRGKKISDPDYNKYTGSTLTSEEKNANRLKYLARAYNLPSVNDLSDVNKAFKGEENFYGQKRTPLQAILRTAGLKVEQYGADEAQLARDKDAMYSANAIDAERSRISQIKNQLGRGEISETQANSRIEAIEKNITKLEAKMGGSGDKNVAGATTGSLPETRVKSLNTIFNVGSINNMPEGSNYEKAQKEAKQFEVINKVLGSDFLTPEEQEQYLSQTTKYKKEEIGYYRVAKGGVDERYGFVLDKIEAQPKDLMQTLATMRYEIDEKKILTNNLIDRLEDEGYLSDAQAKLLKKLEYNQATGKIGKSASGSGSSSNKVAKAIAKLNSENGEDLKQLFDSFAKSNAPGKASNTLPLLQATQKLNAINKPKGKSIKDVLSSKRVIQPIAKIG